MPVPHRHDAHRSASAVLPVFDFLVLFRVRPCHDEAPEVSEGPGAAGDRDELEELSCHDAVDPSVVRGRGFGILEVV